MVVYDDLQAVDDLCDCPPKLPSIDLEEHRPATRLRNNSLRRDIVIVGVGGSSRDLIELIEALNQDASTWNIIGIVDDDPVVHGSTVFGYPVLGSTGLLVSGSLGLVHVAIGVANERQLLIRKEIRKGLRLPADLYPILVHPSAVVSSRAHLSEGAVIMSGVSCSGRVKIGTGVLILQNSAIGHDAIVGDFASISINVSVGGSASIGEGAYLGINCSILPGRRIGKESVIGMGAVIIRDIPNFCVAAGNPGRLLSMPSEYLLKVLG